MPTDVNEAAMARALALAHNSLWLSQPNPRVGCVLVNSSGQEIGCGYTQAAGAAHAEVMALRDAQARGHATQGATAYVTLEPCSHHGRTPPCCDALISAGVATVVASLEDPNPQVSGQGFARLREAGVEVVVGPGAEASRELNIGFFSRMLRGRPWVRLKMAASLDGRTALPNGQSQWITSQTARADGHAWRARACAVLTGAGTVAHDNPRLDVRWVQAPRQPHAVVVDSRLATPVDAAVFEPQRQVFVYAATDEPTRRAALQARGAVVTLLPGAAGRVDLAAMLRELAGHQINELHVEAGAALNGALLREGLADELLVYLAPRLLGEGRGLADWGVLDQLDQAVSLAFSSCEPVGSDLRVLARVQGSQAFMG